MLSAIAVLRHPATNVRIQFQRASRSTWHEFVRDAPLSGPDLLWTERTATSLKQPAEGSADGRIEAVMLGTRVVLRLRAQLEFVTLLHREDQFPWLGVQPIRKPEEAR